MKKILLAISLLIFLSIASAQSDCVPLYGDINGDGVVSVSDLNMLANYLAGNVQLSTVQLAAANVFYDGVIDVLDLYALANYLAGNIPHLPVLPNQ